jgi:DNA processing protein
MARGIDAEGHQGALEAGGTTVAVLGTGIDIVYPGEHKKLCNKIRENGCVVTEFPPGSFPAPHNFPIRNRLISGLSLGTLIPEAREFSGSLITARLTLEQNRELWAVPGNITNPGSYGPNYLVKQGAKPVISVQDVLDELPLHVLEELMPDKSAPDSDSAEPGGPVEDELVSILPHDSAVQFDRLLELTGSSVSELSARLLELEMRGIVKQWPGRRYSKGI